MSCIKCYVLLVRPCLVYENERQVSSQIEVLYGEFCLASDGDEAPVFIFELPARCWCLCRSFSFSLNSSFSVCLPTSQHHRGIRAISNESSLWFLSKSPCSSSISLALPRAYFISLVSSSPLPPPRPPLPSPVPPLPPHPFTQCIIWRGEAVERLEE